MDGAAQAALHIASGLQAQQVGGWSGGAGSRSSLQRSQQHEGTPCLKRQQAHQVHRSCSQGQRHNARAGGLQLQQGRGCRQCMYTE